MFGNGGNAGGSLLLIRLEELWTLSTLVPLFVLALCHILLANVTALAILGSSFPSF
ncbi:hypothetical protein P691DRAFT_801808 [Macrolepiota fuliginosa MF-IS2]|uniref:Uncharacterized protein n=1 Tax=Macrolepiota fuliginosa MF-IS2 TaxID=1400762 RepID=A0A9P5WZI5_9AGAR|nr:hypothetical protein P691DRAFT_801808 [Macrolepiota fuliginosa MF-IS2]